MKEHKRNLMFQWIFQTFVGGLFIVVAIADSLYAQQRGADQIYTVKKDTLRVKITEVGLQEIKYKGVSGDTLTENLMPKYMILKILYGNGDVDDFSLWMANQESSQARKYYRAVPKTPFQREIAGWSDDQLILAKSKYKSNAITSIVAGIAAIHVGAVLYVSGLVNTAFDDSERGTPQIVGGLVGLGGGITLTIFGAKNGRKHRAIKSEMSSRGIFDYSGRK